MVLYQTDFFKKKEKYLNLQIKCKYSNLMENVIRNFMQLNSSQKKVFDSLKFAIQLYILQKKFNFVCLCSFINQVKCFDSRFKNQIT